MGIFLMCGEPNWAPLLLITLSQRCRTRENSAEQQHCGFHTCCYSFPFSWVTCPNSYSIILWVFCPISVFFALVLCGFFAYISGFFAFYLWVSCLLNCMMFCYCLNCMCLFIISLSYARNLFEFWLCPPRSTTTTRKLN